jgi:lysozyme
MRAGQVVMRFGVPLVLASAGLMGFLHKWEDGGKPIPQDGQRVYADRLAKGLPTACNGITKHVSPVPVIVGEYWSAAKCEEISRLVTEKSQLKLLDCFRVRISQNTLDAFSSHSHNFGVPSTCASRALELVNRGQLANGCNALAYSVDGTTPVWSYVDGVFYQGLHNRRKEEALLCMKP